MCIDNDYFLCYFSKKYGVNVVLSIEWTTILGLAVAYIVGTLFGYSIAFYRGRRQGLELTLEALIAMGYIRTGVNKHGETVIYRHWENEKSNNLDK